MMRTLGSVGGGVGLLLLLFTAPLSYFTFESLVPFFVTLALGVAGVILWFVTRGPGARSFSRSAIFFSSSFGLSAAFVILLVAINVIAAKRAPTFDLTSNHVYSLSPQTEAALKGLSHPVHVIGFVKDQPPENIEALFRKYEALNPQFTWEFKDPRRSPDLTSRYQIRESQPAAVLISKEATRESHTILNLTRLLNPQIAEQELTNGILKLEAVGTQKLYFLKGHGEIPLEPLAQTEEAARASLLELNRVLQDEGYAPAELNLVEQGEIPADASALVIANPRNRFSENEQKLLADYLAQGGRLLYFSEAGSESGLDGLLAQYAVQLEPGLVADAKVNPEQPFIVYTPFLGDHEVTKQLLAQQANVVMPSTRGLTKLAADTLTELTATPLVLTTPYAWIELAPSEHAQQDPEERAGQIILAMAVTRPVSAQPQRAAETRLVVFGDSDVLGGAFGVEADRNLVMNAFAWATQQLKKITIRPPDRDLSSLDLTADNLGLVRLLAMDLFPTLLLAVGLTIWLTRRAR